MCVSLHITRSIGGPLRPHLMGEDVWSDTVVDEFCLHLANPALVLMEQEQLDPRSPLAGAPAHWR